MTDRPHHDFQRIVAWLGELRRNGFFGTITLGIQNGEVCNVESKSVTKPGEVLPVAPPRKT